MKKQIDKKKQKLRTASWVTITSTLIAIGGQLLVKSHNPSFEHHEEEHPCGSGAMSDLFDDSPSFEPSGFNIPSWKDGPQLPPGVGGGLIQRPKSNTLAQIPSVIMSSLYLLKTILRTSTIISQETIMRITVVMLQPQCC